MSIYIIRCKNGELHTLKCELYQNECINGVTCRYTIIQQKILMLWLIFGEVLSVKEVENFSKKDNFSCDFIFLFWKNVLPLCSISIN